MLFLLLIFCPSQEMLAGICGYDDYPQKMPHFSRKSVHNFG